MDNFQSRLQRSFPAPKTGAPWLRLDEWCRLGVTNASPVAADRSAMLLEVQGEKGPERWLVFRNFNTITGYNHSAHYAMAVVQLSEEIRRRMPR